MPSTRRARSLDRFVLRMLSGSLRTSLPSYHRKDGKVVKEGDDLLAATRCGVMMLRFAETIYRKRAKYPRQQSGAYSWMDV